MFLSDLLNVLTTLIQAFGREFEEGPTKNKGVKAPVRPRHVVQPKLLQ